MKFQKGDRFLAEGIVDDDEGKRSVLFGPEVEHPHPGVPVADLLEEIEELTELVRSAPHEELMNCWRGDARAAIEKIDRIVELRTAREAANKPQLQEGQEVEVRATVHNPANPDGHPVVAIRGPSTIPQLSIVVNKADIRTDE